MAEQPEYQGYGYNREDKAGKDKLVGYRLIPSGPFGHDGSPRDGRYGALQDKEESDFVADIDIRPEQQETTEAGERKNDILNGYEFSHFN